MYSSRWLLSSLACGLIVLTNNYLLSDVNQRKLVRTSSLLLAYGLMFANKKTDQSELTLTKELPALESEKYTTEPILKLAREANKYPHVMVIGKTGAGKTTIVQYLASVCPGRRFAIAPHLDVSKLEKEWVSCHAVFCGGRHYGSKEDDEITYEDLINNRVQSPSAYQILSCLLTEMDRRYRTTEGFDSHEVDNWLIDETPAIARALVNDFGELIAPLLYEARKVGIRLWILSQNDQVQALRIKGEGKMRDNFTYLYCGESAKVRLRQLKKTVPKMAEGVRWVVVDEQVGLIPDIEEIHATLQLAKVESRFVASLPQAHKRPPTAATIANKGLSSDDVELFARELETLQLVKPEITKTEVLKHWGFSGRYHKVGQEVWEKVHTNEK